MTEGDEDVNQTELIKQVLVWAPLLLKVRNVGCERAFEGVEEEKGASCNQHAGAGAEHPNHASSTAERRRETERQEYGKQTKEILFLRLASVESALESKKKLKMRGFGILPKH